MTLQLTVAGIVVLLRVGTLSSLPGARWDTWVFTPLCAALATAVAVLAAS